MKNELTVLIVDDSSTNNLLCQTIFEENGYLTTVATSGKEALECIEKNIPSIILLDIMMPDLNGFEILEVLKSEERTKNIPVIMVSAKEEREGMRRALEMGAADYVQKPIGHNRLIERVKKIITVTAPHEMC